MSSSNGPSSSSGVPSVAAEAVLVKSEAMPEGAETVRGYDFNSGLDYHRLLSSYRRSGFQATNFGLAVEQIRAMLAKRKEQLPEDKRLDPAAEDELTRRKNNCTIFLGYTSNMASCGVRESIRFLAQHKLVDCIVASAGGVEEDFIKCLAPTYLGDFALSGNSNLLPNLTSP